MMERQVVAEDRHWQNALQLRTSANDSVHPKSGRLWRLTDFQMSRTNRANPHYD